MIVLDRFEFTGGTSGNALEKTDRQRNVPSDTLSSTIWSDVLAESMNQRQHKRSANLVFEKQSGFIEITPLASYRVDFAVPVLEQCKGATVDRTEPLPELQTFLRRSWPPAVNKDTLRDMMLRIDSNVNNVAFLAALYDNYDGIRQLSHPAHQNMTREDLHQFLGLLERHANNESLATAQSELVNKVLASARSYQDQYGRYSTELFADRDNPLASITPQACVQSWTVGNCYLVSAIASLARFNPDLIQQMIERVDDHSYRVRFPGREPVTVAAPTLGELAFYGIGSPQGTWAAVLQKAYGKLWAPNAARPIEGGDGGSIFNDGLRKLMDKSTFSQWNLNTSYREMTYYLMLSLSNRSPVTASVVDINPFSDDYNASGLARNHDYAVIGFAPNLLDARLGVITIYNPHGRQRWTNGRAPQGITDLGQGTFSMSLEMFNSEFSRLNYVKR